MSWNGFISSSQSSQNILKSESERIVTFFRVPGYVDIIKNKNFDELAGYTDKFTT